MVAPTPLGKDEPRYSIRITRWTGGEQTEIEFADYGVLRELLDDIEDAANAAGWFADPAQEP